MDPQFRELLDEIDNRIDKRLDARFTQFEERIEQRMQMHFESMEQLVTVSAEGYGANLDRIERELKELNRKVDTRFGDHDRILTNHNDRITTLEQRER